MAEKRELILDLLARAKTGPGTQKAAKDIDKVGDAADDASKSTEKLGKTTVIAGEGTERLGRKSDEAQDRLDKLDREISKVNQDLVFLAASFADAGDAAERLDISKAIRKAEADLRRLGKSRGLLAGALPDPAPAVRTFTQKLGAGIASSGASIAGAAGSKVGLVVGAAIAATAGPVIVSGIGSALSGVAGAGVIGAGVALAAKDPAIAVTGKQVGKRFVDAIQDEAVDAFRGPVLQSLGMLDAAGQRVAVRWGKAFDALADDVVPFTGSLVRSAERLGDAIANSAEKSGPALRGLGQTIELLADGAGDFIEILADGSPEAAANLTLIAGALADIMRFSGLVLDAFGKLSNQAWLTGPILPLLRKHYQGVAADGAKVSSSSAEVARGFDAVTDAAIEKTSGLQAMREAIQGVQSDNRSLYGSEVDAAQAIADTTKAIRENGRTIDLNTEKGRANRQALDQLAGTLASNYDAYVKVNGAGRGAQEVLARNRAAFIRAAEAAGYSSRKARELANSLLGIPKKTQPQVILRGDESAKGRIEALKKRLASIKNRTVYVRVAMVEGRKLKVEDQLERGRNREFGGPVRKGHAYIVGEKRPEVFVPDRDGKIVPSIEKYQRMFGAAGGMRWAQRAQPVQRVQLDLNLVGAEGKFKDFMLYLLRTSSFGSAVR